MSSTLSGFVTASVKDTFSSLWKDCFGKAADWLLALMDLLFGSVSNAFVDAFENPIIQAIMTILQMICWVVFAVACIFYFLQIAREKQRDWSTITLCFLNTTAFIALHQLICQMFFVVPSFLVSSMQFRGMAGERDILSALPDSTFGGFYLLIFEIAILYFLFISVQRFGKMLLQMLIAPFYVPAFLLGDKQLIADWFKSTAACGFIFVIQYLVFYSGYLLLYFGGSDLSTRLLGISLLLATFSAPSALQRYANIAAPGRGIGQSLYFGGMALSSSMRLLGGLRK